MLQVADGEDSGGVTPVESTPGVQQKSEECLEQLGRLELQARRDSVPTDEEALLLDASDEEMAEVIAPTSGEVPLAAPPSAGQGLQPSSGPVAEEVGVASQPPVLDGQATVEVAVAAVESASPVVEPMEAPAG